jgi:uncharacterized protein
VGWGAVRGARAGTLAPAALLGAASTEAPPDARSTRVRTSRPALALLGAGSLSLASVVLLATPALAHVTVNSPGATQGGFAKLTFRVPTEEAVPTTKLEVVFPTDAPLAFASVKPHAGWSYAVEKVAAPAGLSSGAGPVDKVVSRITWTATDGGIKPGEFDEFEVSAGPLPAVEEMAFKAVQTYQDGDVVRWIETGSGELEHPAPVLRLAAASGADGHHGAATSTAARSTGVSVAAVGAEDEGRGGLGLAGLVAGGLALLVAIGAFVRSGRRA